MTTWREYCRDDPEAIAIHQLEAKCWAPFTLQPRGIMKGRMDAYPDGQLCLVNEGKLLATISTNRIDWDGDPASLSTRSWDSIAGISQTFEDSYRPGGNTFCLMATNVDPDARGQDLVGELMGALMAIAGTANIDYIISPFRPNGYGDMVIQAHLVGRSIPSFEEYVAGRGVDGLPIDHWLHQLEKKFGMVQMNTARDAMEIPISGREFQSFRAAADHQADRRGKPRWQMIRTERGPAWWCGETGFFYPEPDGRFVYREDNMWGRIRRPDGGWRS
ncbi:hypothetical protein [Nocardia sp. NPDC051832]|uniref:hypothetical protein n=1 Tax=Nocardia sp. NPDC051832 TaxID=3155673 RepID=UPI003425610B